MADDSQLGIKITADTKDAEQDIKQVGEKLKDMDVPLRELLESAGVLRKTLVEAFAVHEISELVEHIAELGEAAIRSSEMLGMSVEKVQELGFAARMVGGSADGMDMALARLERNMAEAGNSSSKASQAFEALGISADQIKNKSPDQVVGMIADAFHNAEDGADKTAIAMDLMGRSGAEMIPLLNQGSEGLKQMGLIADDTGSVLKRMKAEGLEQTAQGLTKLKASTEGAGIAFVELLKPGIDTIITGATQLVQWLTDIFNGLRLITEMIETSAIIAFAKMSEEFGIFGVTAEKYIDEIKIGFTTLGQVIDDVAHGHFNKAVQDWEAGSRRIVAAEKDAAASIADISQQYVDFKNKVLEATTAIFTFAGAESESGEKKHLTAPTGSSTKEDDSEEKNQIAIEKNNLATQLELDKLALENRKEIDAEKVASGKMSKQQQLADLKDFAAQEYRINMKALDDEAALYDEDSSEYNALMNKKKIMTAQYNNQVEKLTAQSAQLQTQRMTQMFNSVTGVINRDFDTMLTGVLQGTQTWQAAMGKMFDNLAISAIEAIAKIIAEWLVFEAVTYGQGTWDDFMALEGKGGGGLGSIIPSFDVGSWSIPSDTLAMVHQGEMIIPAAQASAIRSGEGGIGGGSGDIYNITIQAIDTQTGTQFLKKNIGTIVSQLSTQKRLSNTGISSAIGG